MKTQSLEGLLQGTGLVQSVSPQYNNISFEGVLLEVFDGIGLDGQVSSEGLGQKEHSDLSGENHYIQILSEISGMMMVSQTGVGEAQISLDAHISNRADIKEVQITSDTNISRDGVFNTSVFGKTFGDVEKQLKKGSIQIDGLRYYQEPTSGLEAGLPADVSQEHERPLTQELYGYVEMLRSEKDTEQRYDAISRPQEQVKKASSEEPFVGKELSSFVSTQSEEYTHGNVHAKTFDQSRMFYGEIRQNNNVKFEKDRVQENKSLREAVFETNPDYTNLEEPQETFQNKPFSQEHRLVHQEGENLEHFHLKDYGEEEKKGDRDLALGKEGKGMELLAKETISTTSSKEDVPQRVERVERPQTQPFHEAKHINIRFEEGSIRIMLFGDRLRLSMNLSEEFYRPPTTLEVQRLVQSLQSIGFNPEVLRLNGNNLYNSEYRQGSKREDKERHSQFSVQDPSEKPIKNFSLYL